MQMIGHQQVTLIGMSAFGLRGYALLWLHLILSSAHPAPTVSPFISLKLGFSELPITGGNPTGSY